MSTGKGDGKGDRNRSVSKEFQKGFDDIKWPEAKESRFTRQVRPRAENKSARVWSDLEPYQAVGGDMAGKMISGRKEHRDMLRRNNLEEVGSEKKYFFKDAGKSDDNPTKGW